MWADELDPQPASTKGRGLTEFVDALMREEVGMGLVITHGCWVGRYSDFMRWRVKLAELVGIPLKMMDGFYEPPPLHYLDKSWRSNEGEEQSTAEWVFMEREQGLPLKWELLKPDPIHVLLNHSDRDGSIAHKDCLPLAHRLRELVALLPEGTAGGHIGDWREKTQSFVAGLMRAHEAGQDVEFDVD